MVSLVHKAIKFMEVETKNHPNKTACVEKEKTRYNCMLQVLLNFFGQWVEQFYKQISEQIY